MFMIYFIRGGSADMRKPVNPVRRSGGNEHLTKFNREYHLTKSKAAIGNDHLDKCLKCGAACCRYITVRIPGPRSMLDFDNLLWQMYHHDVQVFSDSDGWHLHICNKCINLQSNGKCGIYEKRPFACRDHSANACEFDMPIAEWSKLYFENAAALDAYCRAKFRNWDKRFVRLK